MCFVLRLRGFYYRLRFWFEEKSEELLVSAMLNKCERALEGLFFEKDFCKRILINSKKGMISRIMMPFCYFLKVVS